MNNIIYEINMLVKSAQATGPAPTAPATSMAPVGRRSNPYQDLANSNIKRLTDKNGYFYTQYRNNQWSPAQRNVITSKLRGIKHIRDNPNATPEDWQRAAKWSDELMQQYGTPQNMASVQRRYGNDATFSQDNGLQVRGQVDPLNITNRGLTDEQVERNANALTNYAFTGQTPVAERQRTWTVGSNGQDAVFNKQWTEVAPGISIRPRMVAHNGEVSMDQADQRLIDRYRQYGAPSVPRMYRAPTGRMYVSQNGRAMPWSRWQNAQSARYGQMRGGV